MGRRADGGTHYGSRTYTSAEAARAAEKAESEALRTERDAEYRKALGLAADAPLPATLGNGHGSGHTSPDRVSLSGWRLGRVA